MLTPDNAEWHTMTAERALEALESGGEGLSATEVATRLARFGPNRLPETARVGALGRFIRQLKNPLILVLIVAGFVTASIGHWIDSAVIAGVVIINALIGWIQEGRAENALAAIREMLAPIAMVKRQGRTLAIAADDVVPGDIVSLKSGDRVPADLRLINTHGLEIEEAALTGESVPVVKSSAPVTSTTPLAERTSMVYSGTLVTRGRGLGVATSTGPLTEIGRIGKMVAIERGVETPLVRKMASFATTVSVVIVALAALLFVFGIFIRGFTFQEMLIAAIGMAVAAIPEGLPAVMTVTLAIGVGRMARRNAILRRLPAVETLGTVTTICTDKTGTLTRNEMAVMAVATSNNSARASGDGGKGSDNAQWDHALGSDPDSRALIEAAVMCNDAEIVPGTKPLQLVGSPTETAIVELAISIDETYACTRVTRPRSDAIPFESDHKFMATLHGNETGDSVIFVKGAPERVLAMCAHQRSEGKSIAIDREAWNTRIDALAGDGLRLIAVATRTISSKVSTLNLSDLDKGLEFLGLIGLMDPPRPDAIEAVRRCREAGIRVLMVTGDHPTTAAAIGRWFKLGGRVVTGPELDTVADNELAPLARDVSIFARTTPEHKLRIVRALQASGEVVAMTGDGANDAPALKRADVGVAMGRKGTAAAREASDMVLADDNFASVAAAVEEGRAVYDNLTKAVQFNLPTSFGEALIIITAVLVGNTLPITPVQILWVNMATAVTLGIALAFEPPEAGLMARAPRGSRAPMLSNRLIWRTIFVAVLLAVGAYGLFLYETSAGASVEAARAVAVNSLVAGEVVFLLNCRRLETPAWTWDARKGNGPALTAILIVVILQLGFTYWPPSQTVFGVAAVGASQWLRIGAVAATIFALVEIEKLVVRNLKDPHLKPATPG